MKKYLMMSVAAITMGFVLTSCSKNDMDFSAPAQPTAQEKIQENYNKAFIETFGQPASNQDWGFDSRQLPVAARTTRASNVNGNEWGTANGAGYLNFPHPAAITADELEKVLAVFNQKGAESYEPLADYRNFFVQQVYTGEATYTDGNGTNIGKGSNQMQEMHCVTKYKQTSYWPVEYTEQSDYGWDYINNTSNGNITAWDGCTLMLMSSTLNWKYKSSQDGGNFFEYWRMEKIDGNYYVGFDFSAEGSNPNQKVQRDCIYNDWIIKIVPGEGEPNYLIDDNGPVLPKTYQVRIICEDLTVSSGSDFDFNDVVFDAIYSEANDFTTITVQAAGGTLPLYVAGKEIHQLFAEANPDKNITVKTMINTRASNGISGLDPVTFTIEGQVAPKDIEVKVEKEGELIPLKATTGEPTAKIAVDLNFEWCKEKDDIRKIYPNFSTYVKGGNIEWY